MCSQPASTSLVVRATHLRRRVACLWPTVGCGLAWPRCGLARLCCGLARPRCSGNARDCSCGCLPCETGRLFCLDLQRTPTLTSTPTLTLTLTRTRTSLAHVCFQKVAAREAARAAVVQQRKEESYRMVEDDVDDGAHTSLFPACLFATRIHSVALFARLLRLPMPVP
jgi:hypothetical protein